MLYLKFVGLQSNSTLDKVLEYAISLDTVIVAVISGTVSLIVAWIAVMLKLKTIKEEYLKTLVSDLVKLRYELYPVAISKVQSLIRLSYSEEFDAEEYHINAHFDDLRNWHDMKGASYLSEHSKDAYLELMKSMEVYNNKESERRPLNFQELVQIRTNAEILIDELKKDLLPSLDKMKVHERNN